MLFIEDPYLKEFDAKILNINLNHITLDQTAFYARSGGQPGDVGQLTINGNTINIIDTIKDQENNIIHIAENNIELAIGEKIQGTINWDKRYKHMRMHSALHLLCSVIPLDVTGGQIGYDKSRLDFNAQDYNKVLNKFRFIRFARGKISPNPSVGRNISPNANNDRVPRVFNAMLSRS